MEMEHSHLSYHTDRVWIGKDLGKPVYSGSQINFQTQIGPDFDYLLITTEDDIPVAQYDLDRTTIHIEYSVDASPEPANLPAVTFINNNDHGPDRLCQTEDFTGKSWKIIPQFIHPPEPLDKVYREIYPRGRWWNFFPGDPKFILSYVGRNLINLLRETGQEFQNLLIRTRLADKNPESA